MHISIFVSTTYKTQKLKWYIRKREDKNFTGNKFVFCIFYKKIPLTTVNTHCAKNILSSVWPLSSTVLYQWQFTASIRQRKRFIRALQYFHQKQHNKRNSCLKTLNVQNLAWYTVPKHSMLCDKNFGSEEKL
jgi:hypothetical protein